MSDRPAPPTRTRVIPPRAGQPYRGGPSGRRISVALFFAIVAFLFLATLLAHPILIPVVINLVLVVVALACRSAVLGMIAVCAICATVAGTFLLFVAAFSESPGVG
jgi:hypothetical protein